MGELALGQTLAGFGARVARETVAGELDLTATMAQVPAGAGEVITTAAAPRRWR